MMKRLATTIRREQIAEAALDLVAEQGVAAMTARNVARAIGVTAPALYRHFPGGKAAILGSVLDLLDEVHDEGIRLAQAEQGSFLCKLRRCFDVHLTIVRRYRALPTMLLSDALWLEEPELYQRLRANHLHQRHQIGDIIRQGQKNGEIRADIDADQIFTQFLAQILVIAVLCTRSGELIDPQAQAEANWAMFLQAIRP